MTGCKTTLVARFEWSRVLACLLERLKLAERNFCLRRGTRLLEYLLYSFLQQFENGYSSEEIEHEDLIALKVTPKRVHLSILFLNGYS